MASRSFVTALISKQIEDDNWDASIDGFYTNEIKQRIYKVETVQEEARANIGIVIVHDIHEHSGLYKEFSKKLFEIGCSVFSTDLLGHGRSEGERGKIESFDFFVADIMKYVKTLKQRFLDYKFIIFGLGMGALIAIKCVLEYPFTFEGLITEGLYLEIRENLLEKVSCLMVGFFIPTYGFKEINLKMLSHEEEYIKTLKSDQYYIKSMISASVMGAIAHFMQDMKSSLSEIAIPILLIHGEKDVFAAPEGSRLVYDSCTSKDKTLKLIPHSFHVIHYETPTVKEEFFSILKSWIKDRFISNQNI